jgi:hypothetical protein
LKNIGNIGIIILIQNQRIIREFAVPGGGMDALLLEGRAVNPVLPYRKKTSAGCAI